MTASCCPPSTVLPREYVRFFENKKGYAGYGDVIAEAFAAADPAPVSNTISDACRAINHCLEHGETAKDIPSYGFNGKALPRELLETVSESIREHL